MEQLPASGGVKDYGPTKYHAIYARRFGDEKRYAEDKIFILISQ